MRSLAAISLLLCTAWPAHAELLVTVPSQVCSFLDDAGLATRGWKNQYEQEYGCSSAYKQIDSGFPLANNLAFYAEGNGSSVAQVELMLNINNRAQASSAHQELLKLPPL